MNQVDRAFSLTELARAAGVTPRTVRYYIAQGLLPAPVELGRGAHYGQAHLDRLQLIGRLKKEHLPLSEIRQRLGALDDAEVHDLATTPPVAPQSDSALDYIRGVLGGRGEPTWPPLSTLRARADALASAPPASPPLMRRSMSMPFIAEEPPSRPAAPERSQWDRVAITPDVEIHVRRPLDRLTNRKVDRLLSIARDLFREDAP